MTHAFAFDARFCTGCKACQLACKDRNNLPSGVLWRRVYEVSSGEWTRNGEAWSSTVSAFNLSLACNHCVHPKCAGVCPTGAYNVRPDGIVTIDPRRCTGCGYCAWACPYDAPQLDRSAGVMTKCNLCFEEIDAGLPPACVAACPLRCLDLVQVGEANLAKKGLLLWELPGSEHPFPLPARSRTEPHLIIEPHPSSRQLEAGARVSNREEISPGQPRPTARREIPLIFFTLLAQIAVGAFLSVAVLLGSLKDPLPAGRITLVPLLSVGVAISLGLLGSFFHLGKPQNAWRMLTHLRKSWLSRELLFSALFTVLWAIYTWMRFSRPAAQIQQTSLAFFTALCGLLAVYGMQRVYQLRSVPAWKPGRTLIEFAISTFGLGSLLTAALLPQDTPPEILSRVTLIALLALAAAVGMMLSARKFPSNGLNSWRLGLLLVVLPGTLAACIWPAGTAAHFLGIFFFLALAEEFIGRWLFYLRREPGI